MVINVKGKNKVGKRDEEYLCGVEIWKKVVREEFIEKECLSRERVEVREIVL